MGDMTLIRTHQTPYLSFPALGATGLVHHGFSVREGGVSPGPYTSMNLSYTMGDAPENVKANYEAMAAALGVSVNTMTSVWQAHTNKVKIVERIDCGKGILMPKEPEPCDGMVTNQSGVTLVTLHADCLALYFIDPVNRVIGLCHSGWRGTSQAICQRTLEVMKTGFGSKPEEVLVGIGPGIGPEAFQVGSEVADVFIELLGGDQAKEVLIPQLGGKYLLDLKGVNVKLLLGAGVLKQNLYVTDLCTFCRPDLFFSHRRDGTLRGSMAGFLALK